MKNIINNVKCFTWNILEAVIVLGMISGIIPILAVALIGNLLGIY